MAVQFYRVYIFMTVFDDNLPDYEHFETFTSQNGLLQSRLEAFKYFFEQYKIIEDKGSFHGKPFMPYGESFVKGQYAARKINLAFVEVDEGKEDEWIIAGQAMEFIFGAQEIEANFYKALGINIFDHNDEIRIHGYSPLLADFPTIID